MNALARLKACLVEEQRQNAPAPSTGKTGKSPFEPFASVEDSRIPDAQTNAPIGATSPTAASLQILDMPPEWASAFDAISLSPAPGDYEPDKWRDALAGMESFCAQWAGRAAAIGWQPSEIFSLHPTAPAARHDKRGLALSLTGGARVVGMDAKGADVEVRSGSHLRFYRRSGQ